MRGLGTVVLWGAVYSNPAKSCIVDLDVFIYEFFVKIVKTIILRNHANTARNQGIFRENEQDHSFITDSTRDNEAQFYCRKAGDNLYFSIPAPPPPPPPSYGFSILKLSVARTPRLIMRLDILNRFVRL